MQKVAPSLRAAIVLLTIAFLTVACSEAKDEELLGIKNAQNDKALNAQDEAEGTADATFEFFNSHIPFAVYADMEGKDEPVRLGRTPSAEPIKIPATCRFWYVEPSGIEHLVAAIAEINERSIPGLKLPPRTNSMHLAHVRDLTNLQLLSLEYRTEVTAPALVFLSELKNLRSLNLAHTHTSDDGLKHLAGLADLEELNLWSARITDIGLKHLQNLKNLHTLNLSNNKISGEGLAQIKGLTRLKVLNLWNSQATLEHIEALTSLQKLYIGYTSVTDACLKHLKGMPNLQDLALQGTEITDAGLDHLKGLPNLRVLRLNGTNVTEDGVAELQKALPDTEIFH